MALGLGDTARRWERPGVRSILSAGVGCLIEGPTIQIPTLCWVWQRLEDATTNGSVCSSSVALPTSRWKPSIFSAKGRMWGAFLRLAKHQTEH